MFKRIINFSTLILLGILMCTSVFVAINFTKISSNIEEGTKFDKDHPPLYRLMVILDGSDPSYVEDVKKGVVEACRDKQVAFELWALEGTHKEEKILDQFDIAVESMVDGIIIQAFNDERFDEILGKANYRNIPVITIGTDIPLREKVSFLTFNRYQIGSKIGKLMNEELKKNNVLSGTIVILQNSTISENNQALALNEELDNQYITKPEQVIYQGEYILNAEGVTREIVDKYDDLIGIVCSSGEETLGVIQALKDTNKMNEVIVVGFDDSIEIRDYIERGILFATIVADNERLGYEAIVSMVENNNGQFVSMYKDINVQIITKENLEEHIKDLGEENEKKNFVN